jgi:hypothetical protein
LWRTPEIISYFAIILLALSYWRQWLDIDKSKYIFLLSISVVAPIVFNQQILTGYSLQPFHYQLYGVNYISLFVLVIVSLMLISNHLVPKSVKTAFAFVGLISAMMFIGDLVWGAKHFHNERVRVDELQGVASRIRDITSIEGGNSRDPSVVMSFDLTQQGFPDSNYLPSLSSQPILWSVYISTFPDVSPVEDRVRLNTFIYYHGLNGDGLKRILETNFSLSIGFFGAGRVFPQLTTGANPITESEIAEVSEQYEAFRQKFSYEDAKTHTLHFVLTRNDANNNLTAIDRWYERDSGEQIGSYTLYRVKLRPIDNSLF